VSKKFEYIAFEKIKKDGEKIPYCFLTGFCMYKTLKNRCSFKHPCRHKKEGNDFTYVRNDSDDNVYTVGDEMEGKKLARLVKARR